MTALCLAPSVWGLVAATKRPSSVWSVSGHRRGLWIGLFVAGLWFWFLGIPAAIIFRFNVLPHLRAVEGEQGNLRALSKAWIGALILVTGFYTMGWFAYIAHDHSFFADAALARRASAECRKAQAEFAALPRLPEKPSLEARAEVVDETVSILERLVARLRGLSPPGRDDEYDDWLEHWDDFLDVGPRYAAALRAGDREVYERIGNQGDEPSGSINTIAKENGMKSCVF